MLCNFVVLLKTLFYITYTYISLRTILLLNLSLHLKAKDSLQTAF